MKKILIYPCSQVLPGNALQVALPLLFQEAEPPNFAFQGKASERVFMSFSIYCLPL